MHFNSGILDPRYLFITATEQVESILIRNCKSFTLSPPGKQNKNENEYGMFY